MGTGVSVLRTRAVVPRLALVRVSRRPRRVALLGTLWRIVAGESGVVQSGLVASAVGRLIDALRWLVQRRSAR